MASAESRKRVALRLFLLPLAGWAVMVAGGYYPTRALAGPDGLRAMVWAQLLVAGVVFATLLPAMRSMVGKSAVEGFKIAMLAGVVRFLATACLLVAVAWAGRVCAAPFLVWGGIAYLVMVLLEAVALARWLRYLESEKRC